jgi:hypothetical protein
MIIYPIGGCWNAQVVWIMKNQPAGHCLDSPYWKRYNSCAQGPVAQLGARFNRTEEAEGSNPSRSTDAGSSSVDDFPDC